MAGLSWTLKTISHVLYDRRRKMQNPTAVNEWREKVNPLFTIGVRFSQFISRLLHEIHTPGDLNRQTAALFVEICKNSIPLLPSSLERNLNVKEDAEKLAASFDEEFLVDPEVRRTLSELLVRLRNSPEALLGKGFEKPHWWMGHASWSEFLKTEPAAQSLRREPFAQCMFNILSLLHFQIPLEELTQRVTEGDPKLSARLFRFDAKALQESGATSEKLLESINDRATKIVGRALLFKGEPPGYQLRLRMVLFFGWNFGLCDLSNDELYAFLNELQIIPGSYDPESLRKFRSRLLALIRTSPKSVVIDTVSASSSGGR